MAAIVKDVQLATGAIHESLVLLNKHVTDDKYPAQVDALNVVKTETVPVTDAVKHVLSVHAFVTVFHSHVGKLVLVTKQLSYVFLAPHVVGKSIQPATVPFTGLADTQLAKAAWH